MYFTDNCLKVFHRYNYLPSPFVNKYFTISLEIKAYIHAFSPVFKLFSPSNATFWFRETGRFQIGSTRPRTLPPWEGGCGARTDTTEKHIIEDPRQWSGMVSPLNEHLTSTFCKGFIHFFLQKGNVDLHLRVTKPLSAFPMRTHVASRDQSSRMFILLNFWELK